MRHSIILGIYALIAALAMACAPTEVEQRLPTERAELPTLADIPEGYYAMESGDELPLETFLIDGSRLNARVQERSALFRFASNREDATFECSIGATTAFKACDGGASLRLASLEHGKAYQIQVRATLPSGQSDVTPLNIEFVADMLNGGPLYLPHSPPEIPRHRVDSVADLPLTPAPSSTVAGSSIVSLLLGEEDIVLAPSGMIVSSFSAVKSLAMNLLTFRLAADPQDGCGFSWERLVQHPLGPWYCEGFPTEENLAAMERPIARNHVRLERTAPSHDVRESLYAATLAASGEEKVQADLAIDALCPQAQMSGSAPGPRFPSRHGAVGSIQWCLVMHSGGSWWIARWDDDRSRSDGAHLLAIYTAQASSAGLLSPELFLRRARQYMTTTIVPSGQTRY